MDNTGCIVTHLVVIVDLNPPLNILQKNDDSYERWLNSIISFCISHLLLNQRNKLHVIASNFASCDILYPISQHQEESLNIPPNGGQYQKFNYVAQVIFHQIKACLKNSRHWLTLNKNNEINDYPLISGAMARGLCCIQRYKNEVNSSRMAFITANRDDSSAFASQFMNFMNVFFTARKMNVVIDTCILSHSERAPMSIFQQGCDLTGGIYLKVSNVNAFLEYLVWTMLPDVETRKFLVLPVQKKISYKAACFCHRTLIDIGFVCSVCLSIFCSFSPICSTCQTAFKLGPIPLNIKSKRKVKLSK